MVDSSTVRRSGRLNMRVPPEQEHLLRAAAALSGESVTGFVLAAATSRARDVVEVATRIELGTEAFERFASALDDEPQDLPVLRRYARARG